MTGLKAVTPSSMNEEEKRQYDELQKDPENWDLRLELAAVTAQRLLVEDVEGRAELPRQIDGVAAAESEVALFVHGSSDGKDARQRQAQSRLLCQSPSLLSTNVWAIIASR